MESRATTETARTGSTRKGRTSYEAQRRIPPARGACPNWDNFQCYCCQQKGHILCYCPQNPRNNQPHPQQGRRTQTNNYYKQEEPIQVAHAIVENCTPQECAHEILGYMANQDEAVKDELIKELWNGGDFPNT